MQYHSFPRTRGLILINASPNSNIILGHDIDINSGKKRNPVGMGFQTSWIVFNGAKLEIGNHVGMSNVTLVSKESIVIEDNVMLGNGVTVYDTDFHSTSYAKRCQPIDDDIASKPVRICEGAFVGAGSIILKGVTIGSHSIIGAGSVVTKSVPAHQIWAGNPARYIKDTPD